MIFSRTLIVASAVICATAAMATPITTTVLNDFEGAAPTVARVTASNSSSSGDSFSAASVTSEGGSNRLTMTDAGGNVNGIVLTIPNAFTEAGFYMITADIKVASTSAGPISTFGMAAKVGSPTTARVLDGNAGYVYNLPSNTTNGAALGYQTIGAGIPVDASGSFPKNLTLYFSTDPSGTPSDGHADFAGSHRGSGSSLPTASNTSAIYIDNIKKIGPGRFGEERHLWISVGDGMTNLTTLNNLITAAANNGFNAIDILVRYRTNRYYINNRNFSTYANSEPAISGVNANNDPIQFAIDRGHELGLRVYGSFSCFLATDSSSYPSQWPSGSINYVYNGGSPVAQSGSSLWADVGRADVRAYATRIMMDIVQNYDLDGIIFDRIRYDGTSNGYNPVALSEMGIGSTPAPTNANFMQKRREAVADFLHDSYVQATTLKPWMVVGTVPIAYGTGMYETYNTVFQSWPLWTATPTANRTITFGAQDSIQPQFYRMWDSSGANAAPNANRTLMQKALYGDTANDSMDFGLMPGSNALVAPLFYTESLDDSTDAANTASAMATNMCDARSTYYMNGFGAYSATPTVNAQQGASVISRIRALSTACGTDIMSPAATLPDFLMKQGWDNTPPNAPSVTVNNLPGGVQLTWPTPVAAEDGEIPTKYLIYRSATSDVKAYYANLQNKTTNVTGNSFTQSGISGTFYYRILAVDDFNNKAASTVIGPVTVSSSDIILESRLAGGALNTSTYSESPAMLDTTSKSTAAGLTGTGSRYRGALPASATFTPNITAAGLYNVYVTVGGAGNTNNDATTNFTITNSGAPVTGSVRLLYSDGTVGNAWKLLASNVPLAVGSGGNIKFDNVDGDGAGALQGNRFVMDAVKFTYVSSSVDDWQLY